MKIIKTLFSYKNSLRATMVRPNLAILSSILVSIFAVGCGGGDTPVQPLQSTVILPERGTVTADTSGNIFICNPYNNTLIKVNNSGIASLIAGQAGVPGVSDGTGSTAQFSNPNFPIADSQGNIFLSDAYYYGPKSTVDIVPRAAIRKVTLAGVVSTFAGSLSAGNPMDRGSVDGLGSAARFVTPAGLAFDKAGNLFVADTGAATIRKISVDSAVTTFAGAAGNIGYVDGGGMTARFSSISNLVSDTSDNLYVTDTILDPINIGKINNAIRKISPTGVVTTLASNLVIGNAPPSLTINPTTGSLYFADGNTINKVSSSGAVLKTAITYTGIANLAFISPSTLVIFADGVIRRVQIDN